MSRVLGYARVSTDQQETSATVQERRLREYAANSRLELVGIYVDQDVSGAKPLKHRPQGKRLWDALQRGDTVAFTKVDRAFRSLVDAASTVEVWQQLGVRVVILDCGLDLNSPAGQLFFSQLVAFAQFERQILGQRLKEALAHMRKEGRPYNNLRPYGWQRVGAGKSARFQPLEAERALGQEVVTLRAEGRSWQEIAIAIMERGVTKPGKSANSAKSRGVWYLESDVRRLHRAAVAGFPIAPRGSVPAGIRASCTGPG
jgi:DNA invertase Pin-like site-specific DNA recombinase